MASQQMIGTAFRGTQLVEMRDWLTDTTTPPWPDPNRTGFIHYGFGEALNGMWPQISSAVHELRGNGQILWFTTSGPP
jgi:hypothetical protein